MFIDLAQYVKKNDVIAVAVSGGSDSMALLHYMFSNRNAIGYSVVALNVEHGIRGEESISDSKFVADYCEKNGIPLLSYSVDCIKHSQEHKLSMENSARILRYDCFKDALNGKCTKIATAHHVEDNTESVLINLFRGTGLKGSAGIFGTDKIIRPMIDVKKEEITDYLAKNNIPYVTDSTNLSTEYTRNFLRLKVLPLIREVFPEADKSISNFCKIAKTEDEFLDKLARELITEDNGVYKIPATAERAIFTRAIIICMQNLDIERDWQKVHVDSVFALASSETGKTVTLPKNVVAVREYDNIVLYKNKTVPPAEIHFKTGLTTVGNAKICVEIAQGLDLNALKGGFYADANKIPQTAVFRTRKDGDVFTKFGGGTKKLNDYFTDIKVPNRLRDDVVIVADGNDVLAILGYAISDKVKVDSGTKTIVQIIAEK